MRLSALILLLLAAPPARGAVAGANSVGMCIHVGHEGFLDGSAALGARWVRMDANWFHLEPAAGAFNWSDLDAWVARASERDLHVFLTLAYTPAWVVRHGDSDGISHNDVPDASTEWVSFVEAAVNRYRAAGVTHFGMWNEANLGGFFEGSVEEYVDLIVVPGAAAVRNVCADCLVLGPDLAHVGDADDYLEAVLTRAPLGTFDIITHHSYNAFAETGWQIWDGDSFINVLDQQRFALTRRSLRQVLDSVGYSGEVWITETGYRAAPAGDSEAESLQAIHVRRVLEEQLLRSWYTNTFLYEIHDCGVDQPECDIDGFGLMRAESGSPGSRVFPDDYRLKPAFLAVRQFIEEHPEIVGAEPATHDGGGEDGANDDDGGDPAAGDAAAGDARAGDARVGDARAGDARAGDAMSTRAHAELLTGGCACRGGAGVAWLAVLVAGRRRRARAR